MKKIVSIVLILMMMTGVFADTAVPTLYSELPFELTQEGDIFTIILDENPTTGYTWSYVVSKEEHVKFISDEYISQSNLHGASGKHHYTFEVLADGVSTIDFKHHRSFEENSTIDSIDVLVYKSGEKVFVEENAIVTINEPVLISEPIKTGVVVSNEMLEMDTAVPTLYSELPFELTQEGDIFTIILDENGSTGYTWSYVVNKEEHVKFISDEYITGSNIPGAPGKHYYTFEVLADGVSTIDFTLSRSFEENSTIDSIDVLVYKSGEKVFVEENAIVTIDEPVLISEPIQSGVVVSNEMLEMDTTIQTIDGVTMVPVAETLKALGYDVKWVSETQSIEISKGAQWTSITLGKNAYFKNKMAARPLSAAPVIYNNRAMVPVEFFNVILDLGIQVKEGQIEFNDYDMGVYSGYIKEIKINDKGTVSLFLTYEEGAEMVDVVIHTSNETTFVQGSIKVGDQINALTSMATTRSIPPQTAGYIIY